MSPALPAASVTSESWPACTFIGWAAPVPMERVRACRVRLPAAESVPVPAPPPPPRVVAAGDEVMASTAGIRPLPAARPLVTVPPARACRARGGGTRRANGREA